ncbi:hypothetical protein D3C85_1226120 [compost metagenome]
MGLEHHRATGGQGRSGVATRGRKCQGKIAGTEHGYRPETDAVLAQIRTRQRLAVGQCLIDARTVEIAATQYVGEQTHLTTGAPALPHDPRRWQRGFAADQRNEIITQRIQLSGNRIEKLRATLGAQAAISRERCSGSFGSRIHFLRRSLDKIMGQRLAGFSINAL